MTDNISLFFGFLGGIFGGILVNIVSFHYKKRVERNISSEDAIREYKAGLIGRLNEIITFWNAENASRFSYRTVQNKFEIFARQISKDISNQPTPLRQEICTEFQDLIIALNRVRDFITAMGRQDQFRVECNAVIEKVEHIKKLDLEWFEPQR